MDECPFEIIQGTDGKYYYKAQEHLADYVDDSLQLIMADLQNRFKRIKLEEENKYKWNNTKKSSIDSVS